MKVYNGTWAGLVIVMCTYIVSYQQKQLNIDMYTYSYICIKTSGSESRGQEEAASTRIFKPMRPLQ